MLPDYCRGVDCERYMSEHGAVAMRRVAMLASIRRRSRWVSIIAMICVVEMVWLLVNAALAIYQHRHMPRFTMLMNLFAIVLCVAGVVRLFYVWVRQHRSYHMLLAELKRQSPTPCNCASKYTSPVDRMP
jgi:hypothetical protein